MKSHNTFVSMAAAAILVTPSLLAQATLHRDCDPNSAVIQVVSTNGLCVNTISTDASYLRLPAGARAILYPVRDCAGTVTAGVAADANFCANSFSDGRGTNDAVRSLFISTGPSPSILSGTFRSAAGRELQLDVSEDGRVSGYVTVIMDANQAKVKVPINSGVVRWATLGLGPQNLPDLIQPTEDFYISLSACAGPSVPGFLDNSMCISFTGGAEVDRGHGDPEVLTLQSAVVRGNQQRGFDLMSPAAEAFTRLPGIQGQSVGQLALYWSNDRQDNSLLMQDGVSARDALNTQYTFIRSEPAYIFKNQEPGTVALNLYWSWDRTDNILGLADVSGRDHLNTQYFFIRTEGYIYKDPQPNTVALKLYFSWGRLDNVLAAEGGDTERELLKSGYFYVRTEGYALRQP